MKKLYVILMAGVIACGCAGEKRQEEALRDSVINMHEKLMGEDEKITNNKSALDSLIKQSPDTSVKDSAKIYGDKLAQADTDMMTWMHNFNPDQTGKAHEEVMSYFAKQKKQIMHIDSEMSTLTKQSDAYLAKTKKK